MSSRGTVPLSTDEQAVLANVAEMIAVVLADDGGVDIEIGMDTQFIADLDMESIDLVALAAQLQDHYGERVNFAEFLASFDIDEIFVLTVGRLVHHIVGSPAATGES